MHDLSNGMIVNNLEWVWRSLLFWTSALADILVQSWVCTLQSIR